MCLTLICTVLNCNGLLPPASGHGSIDGVMAAIEPFVGFSEETFAFLRGLKENNEKAWFDAHRKDYDAHVVAPSRSFVVAMGGQLQSRISTDICAEPKANGSLGRINRDIRFSADKTPYNTHLSFTFWEGGSKKTCSQFVVWLSADGVMVGAGMRGFDKKMLARYRDAIVADESGSAFEDIIKSGKRWNLMLSRVVTSSTRPIWAAMSSNISSRPVT